MVSLTTVLLASVVAIVIYRLFFKNDGKKYPKGPFAWPVFGNALQLGGDIGQTLINWSKKYGDVYQLWFGMDRCYVVTDLKLAKDLFNDNVFSSRPDNELFHLFSDGAIGVVNSSGQVWSDQRRFTLRHLRDFGFGKQTGEEMVLVELREFLDNFAKDVGKPVVINRTFQMAVINTLWQIMAGVRYEHDDPRLWTIFKQNKEIGELASKNPFLFFVPSLAKRFPELMGWNKFKELASNMKQVVKGHVDSHKNSRPEDGSPRDFMDSYINEIDGTSDSASSFYKENGIQNLTAVIGDLFGAGFETVTLTLSWCTLYLVKYPEHQKKFQAELDRVVGRNRSPALSDRASLPYIEATIAESMRIATIVPLGLFHTASEDTKIREYDVPKGSWVIAPLHVFHYNEEFFPNPTEFKPERFLSPDGKKFVKHEALVPFAFGKRACLGETLARDEVFLFITHMFHRFSIRPADENPDPSSKPVSAFAPAPVDYKVVMTERN